MLRSKEHYLMQQKHRYQQEEREGLLSDQNLGHSEVFDEGFSSDQVNAGSNQPSMVLVAQEVRHRKQFTLGGGLEMPSSSAEYQAPDSNDFLSGRLQQQQEMQMGGVTQNRSTQRNPTGLPAPMNTQQTTPKNEDSDYDLCFVVEDVEFLTLKEGFIAHSPYLRDLIGTIGEKQDCPKSQIRILLPLWATARAFRVLLDYVNSSKPFSGLPIGDDELQNVQNLLWLADFFQIFPLQRMCIDKHITPRLAQQTVLPFLEDAFAKLAQCQQTLAEERTRRNGNQEGTLTGVDTQYVAMCEDMWYSFFSRCLEVCSSSLESMIRSSPAVERELLALPEAVLEEVFERAFTRLHYQANSGALDTMVKFMLKSKTKRCKSVFDLLTDEKAKAMKNYRQRQIPRPILTWKLGNLNLRQNFYKESDEFTSQHLQWRLYISKTNDKDCQVGVRLPTALTPDVSRFISLLSWVKVASAIEGAPPIESKGEDLRYVHLTTAEQLTPDKQPQVFLRAIPLLLIHQANCMNYQPSSANASVNIEVYFSMNYTVSALLTYISDKFSQLTTRSTDPNTHPITQMQSTEMALILNDRYLGVKAEDEVVDAIITWLQANVDRIDEKVLVEDIMRNVNWNFVSFEKMLDLYKTFPRLRSNIHTKAIFHNQLKYRATKKTSNQPAQMQRAFYDSVVIETMFDFHYFLDKVADYLFRTFDAVQSQQPNQSQLKIQKSSSSSKTGGGTPQRRQLEIQLHPEQVVTYPSDNQLSSQRKKRNTVSGSREEAKFVMHNEYQDQPTSQTRKPAQQVDQALKMRTPSKKPRQIYTAKPYGNKHLQTHCLVTGGDSRSSSNAIKRGSGQKTAKNQTPTGMLSPSSNRGGGSNILRVMSPASGSKDTPSDTKKKAFQGKRQSEYLSIRASQIALPQQLHGIAPTHHDDMKAYFSSSQYLTAGGGMPHQATNHAGPQSTEALHGKRNLIQSLPYNFIQPTSAPQNPMAQGPRQLTKQVSGVSNSSSTHLISVTNQMFNINLTSQPPTIIQNQQQYERETQLPPQGHDFQILAQEPTPSSSSLTKKHGNYCDQDYDMFAGVNRFTLKDMRGTLGGGETPSPTKEAVFSSQNILDEFLSDEDAAADEGIFYGLGRTIQNPLLNGEFAGNQIPPARLDLEADLNRYAPDHGGTEVTSRERHFEKVKMSQRRLSGMKFMGDLNNSFKQ